ncbi:hypothetical protein L249_3200 [Ophiocordyceps polyrhachis-furcata BCC 54312]|uniref:GPR1/FUN34/YaaH-class plasma membrane protein n=1 Tax=Ophiocordyceps polyrhachis-furcata BCC 54312 TaxID=1330021 RepID=A0A367LPI3_9HYPO|nr:hypothetical protein L249_3200 [Ophiocordyceps polyrhachis-furcata BCC 54312]
MDGGAMLDRSQAPAPSRSLDAILPTRTGMPGKLRTNDLAQGGNCSTMSDKTHPSPTPRPDGEDGRLEALQNLRTATSVSMSPELFEKLYLTPANNKGGNLRRTFGNGAPLGLAGFIICLSPLSADLMGWRGAGGHGNASLGSFWFQGGILMIIGCVLEWVLGNTFPAVTFGVYGTFWMGFAATQTPAFAIGSAYAPGKSAIEGMETRGYHASNAWWLLFMAIMSLLFCVCALRTNVVLTSLFFCIMVQFTLQTGASLALANDFETNKLVAKHLGVSAGAFSFIASIAGWYLLTAELLAAVDFPYQLNVGHLGNVLKGKSHNQPGKEE